MRLRHDLREALVDPHVRLPPVAVERRRGDDVVVERPEGAVREALVVLLDLLRREPYGVQVQAVLDERFDVGVGQARPPHPRAVPAAEHRFEGRDEPTRAALPAPGSVGQLLQIDG
jgi:hypothetical protein